MALRLLAKRNDLCLYEDSSFNTCDNLTCKFYTLIAKEFALICKNYSLNTERSLFTFAHHFIKQIILMALEDISDSIYLKDAVPDSLLAGINVANVDYIVTYDYNLYLIKIGYGSVNLKNETLSVFEKNKKELFCDSSVRKFRFSVSEIIDSNLLFLFYQNPGSNLEKENYLSAIMAKHEDFCSAGEANWNCLWTLNPEIDKRPTGDSCYGVSILAGNTNITGASETIRWHSLPAQTGESPIDRVGKSAATGFRLFNMKKILFLR